MGGQVINALSSGKNGHIPYRDSKLTHVLSNSLGGNCKTTLIVTASLSKYNREETIASLRFGRRCKMVTNKAKINKIYSNEELLKRIKELEAQNDALSNGAKQTGMKMNFGQNVELLAQTEEIKELEDKLKNIQNDRDAMNETVTMLKNQLQDAENDKQTMKMMGAQIKDYDDRQNELKQRLLSLEQTESTLHSELLRLQSLNQNMEQLKLSNMENITRQKSMSNDIEAQKLKFEQERLCLEQRIVDQENINKDQMNKQTLLDTQNQLLLKQNKRLKTDILDKNEQIKQQQIKFEEMHKQKNEVLKNESAQNNTNELEKEYEAKMNILQSEYAQIANSCKAYEESMKFELIRKKKEMDAMYMKKESVLKKKLYKQIRDEMQKEMDAECMKMFKMQERAQSDLNELNVLKESNKKQMNEINALKMKSIENNQKIENVESEKQSLLSKIQNFEKQMEHRKNIKKTQQNKIKSLQEQNKMDREKSQFQFNLMEKRYKQRLDAMQNELNMEKAKKESIKIHFDAKEEKIKKHKREQSDRLSAKLIEQQLAYLDSVDCLKYHKGIHEEISHNVAVNIHKKEQEKKKQYEVDGQIAAVLNEDNNKKVKDEKFRFEKELMQIVKMGFNEIDTIKGLLIQFNGKQESVVQALLRK